MNPMTDIWTTFQRDQGQIVTTSYRYDWQTDRIIRQTHAHSDGEIHYSSAPCPEDVEWYGGEAIAPWDEPLDWTPCDDPFAR